MFHPIIDILEGGLWEDWLSDSGPLGLDQFFLRFFFIRVDVFFIAM